MEFNSNLKNKYYKEKDIEEFERQQNADQLSKIFNNLYHSLYPDCPNNYILPQNLQNLLQRILSTNFSVMKNDESILINSLLEKVYKLSNYNKETMNKFQYLYSKLTKKNTFTQRWGILYMLNYFSKKNSKNLNFSATNELQQKYLKETNDIFMNNNCIDFLLNKSNENTLNDYDNNINNIGNIDNIINYDLNHKDCNINCSKKCKKYLNNLSPVSNINEDFCQNENLIICNDKMNNKKIKNNFKYSPIVINPKKTSLTITEKDIINDLLFVFEGINGKYIAYDASEDAFILNKLIPWSEEIYNIVNSLSELGWLYRKIKSYIDYYKYSNNKSQFIQSLIYSIQKELNEYFQLISFFKKLNSNNRTGNEIGKKTLNLKNLVLWTLKPKEKLKWIASCCESVHTLKGVSVLSQIYSFVNYAGSAEYLNNILNEVSRPFINFIINWIKYGELQDPYKEFFVDILTGVSDDNIWNLKYQLIGKNVPNFMKREPTLKIFEVGKCIHFIRNYCKETYNLSYLKDILAYLIRKYRKFNNNIDEDEVDKINFDYGFDEDKIIYEIESLQSCYEFINYLFISSNQENILNISFMNEIINNIDIIHKLINKELVRIVYNKFKFYNNLESLNKYLLLGQGDMMQTLIESLFEELDKPANLILKHNLQSNLESAIRASNAHFKDEENIKKLAIKLMNPSPGDSGWDIFCLEYNVDLPLKIIFNSKLLKDYQKIFLFFWKIKHIKFGQINHIWKKMKKLNDNFGYISSKNFIKKTLKLSIHFNQEIVHFISNLHNYFALEVLETQYKNLKNELTKINNLDELIKKHKQFVDNIKDQCLLNKDNITINGKIFTIFDIILKFRTSFDVFSSFLDEIHYENRNNISKDSVNLYINSNRIKNIKEYLKQILILYKEFHNQIIEFINMVELIGKNNLKFLAMKLDFNYFYSFIEKEEEDRKNLLTIKKINEEKERRKILDDEDDKEISVNYNENDNNGNDGNNHDINDINENDNINNISENPDNDNDNENYYDNDDDNNNNGNIHNEYNNYKKSNKDINKEKNNENLYEKYKNNNKGNVSKDEQNNKLKNDINQYNKINNNFQKKYNLSNDYKNKNIIQDNINNKKYNLDNKNQINNVYDNNKISLNNFRENDSDYLNNLTKSKNYDNSLNNEINNYSHNSLNNTDSMNNNYILKDQSEQKTYQYNDNTNNIKYNYNNNEDLEPNLDDIDDDDKITTNIKPKIYGVATRTKKNK